MINYIAVIVAALSGIFLRLVWYSPMFFGEKEHERTMFLNSIAIFIMAFVLGYLVDFVKLTLMEATEFGFLLWLGIAFTTKIGTVIRKKANLKLFMINTGYDLLNIVIMILIITSMPYK